MPVHATTCHLCKSVALAPLALENGLRLVRCQDCSLVFLDLAEEGMPYVQKMEADFFGRGALSQRDLLARWFALRQAKRRLRQIARYRTTGELLEIGSGTGEFLSLAQTVGFRSVGLELSPDMAEHAVRHYNVLVYCQRLAELPLEEKFDVVVMNHVLEHMENPVQTLSEIKAVMKGDAILYIAVPNQDSWEAHFSGWTSYEPYHLFYYSPATLRETLRRSGFDILSSSTFEPFSGWVNTLLRSALKEHYLAARAQAHAGGAAAPGYRKRATMTALNAARLTFGSVTTPLRWMQAKVGKGEELVTIAAPGRWK
jgi:SAM-dependent methyltransferase